MLLKYEFSVNLNHALIISEIIYGSIEYDKVVNMNFKKALS